MTRKLVRVYVDETGDRGTTARASRFFSMAAVAVADEHDGDLRDAVSRLRQQLSVPNNKPLHWQEHVKTFARRRLVIQTFAHLPLTLNYVIIEKTAIPAQAGMRNDQAVFYNYVAGLLMERLLLTGREWPGGAREIVVNFGHVRGFDHQETREYFALKKVRAPGWVPWHLLHSEAKFRHSGDLLGLQAADQYAGALNAAMVADRYGNFEEPHLMDVRHQIRRNSQGRAWGYGFKVLATPTTMGGYPWWSASGLG